MSNKRKKLQDDLERREQAASSRSDLERAEALLKHHMDRIRMENLQRMRREVPSMPSQQQEEEEEQAKPEMKRRILVPHSQSFQSLDSFESHAFQKLANIH